jgi:hypothetical protein
MVSGRVYVIDQLQVTWHLWTSYCGVTVYPIEGGGKGCGGSPLLGNNKKRNILFLQGCKAGSQYVTGKNWLHTFQNFIESEKTVKINFFFSEVQIWKIAWIRILKQIEAIFILYREGKLFYDFLAWFIFFFWGTVRPKIVFDRLKEL